jgi:hypothetical protein
VILFHTTVHHAWCSPVSVGFTLATTYMVNHVIGLMMVSLVVSYGTRTLWKKCFLFTWFPSIPAWCSCGRFVGLLNLWPYVSINHAFEGKFLSNIMFPRLEALDLQMNQIVYTFYTCFGASQQSNPMQTRGPFGWILRGFCLMRLESVPWAGGVWCLPWDHPFVRIKLCSIIVFWVFIVSQMIIITCVHYI